MDRAKRIITGRIAEFAILAAVMLAAGCASQDGPNETSVRRESCPGNMALRCFKHTAEVEQCTCVTQQKIEDLIDDSIGN